MTTIVAHHAQKHSVRPIRAGRWVIEHRARVLTGVALVALVSGAVATLAGAGEAGEAIWGAATALLAAELAFEVFHTIVRDRHMGVDTIALVAMVGAPQAEPAAEVEAAGAAGARFDAVALIDAGDA